MEIFSRDTRPRSSQSTRVSWLNRTEALLNRQYGRVAHWNAVMHRYIYVKLPVVGLWRIFRLKQTIGMQGERPIYSSLDGMEKKPTFPDKGDIGLWPSGSLPDARYSSVSLLLHPWKRGWKSEILSEQTRSASKLDVSRMCFFWPLKATCPRIVAHRHRQLFIQLMGNIKQWAAVYETTRSTLSLRLRFRWDGQLTILGDRVISYFCTS